MIFQLKDFPSFLCTVIFSGIYDVVAKSNLVNLNLGCRKLLRLTALSESELEGMRMNVSASLTSSQIIELLSVLIVPMMIIAFRTDNRFVFNFGYLSSVTPDEAVNLWMLVQYTTIQFVFVQVFDSLKLLWSKKIHLLTDTKYFSTCYNGDVFMVHCSGGILALVWMFLVFQTIPNELNCTSRNECECFPTYSALCNLTASRTTNDISTLTSNDFIPPVIASVIVVMILLGTLLSLWILHKQNTMSVEKIKSENETKINALKNIALKTIKEQTSLQNAIEVLLNLMHSSPPSEAKILENVINTLTKSKIFVEADFVDYKTLNESIKDLDSSVVDWLKSELTPCNNDIIENRDNSSYYYKPMKVKTPMKKSRSSGISSFIKNQKRKVIPRAEQDENTESEEDDWNENSSNLLEHVLIPSSDDTWQTDLLTWDFNVFSITSTTPLALLAWETFSNHKIPEKLNLSRQHLQSALIMIDENYALKSFGDSVNEKYCFNSSTSSRRLSKVVSQRKLSANAYHNNLHAADVFQAVLHFLFKQKHIFRDFSILDDFSLLFAAYIHDFVSRLNS